MLRVFILLRITLIRLIFLCGCWKMGANVLGYIFQNPSIFQHQKNKKQKTKISIIRLILSKTISAGGGYKKKILT